MGATRAPVDKTTRQDLILRLISERELGTQQGVVQALGDEGVEVAQATVSRDLAELGVLKVGNRYLALPHDPGSAGIEVLPSFVLGIVPAGNQVVIHTRDGTAGAVSSVLDRVRGLKVLGTIAGQDTVLAISPNSEAAEEVSGLLADVCRAKTRPAGNVEYPGTREDLLRQARHLPARDGGRAGARRPDARRRRDRAGRAEHPKRET